jgi:DNA-binding NtrC family response regulator
LFDDTSQFRRRLNPESGYWTRECIIQSVRRLGRNQARRSAARTHVKGSIMTPSPRGNHETILVVDDNELTLEVVVAILRAENFRVLSADSGPAAIMLAEKTSETIDLLLSDVEMPQMSGPDLGEALKKTRPDMHVMLMSGGVNGNLLVLNYGWAYIQKPLVAAKLVQMIRDVLHSEDRSQLGGQEFDSRKDRNRTVLSN